MNDKINYTTINHIAREELELTWIEYGLVDLIHNLSNNPRSDNRWCYASKQTLANNLGVTKQYIHKMINKLIDKGLIEKHEETSYLRTTELWFEKVIKRDSKSSLLPVNKVYYHSKQSLHNNNNYINKEKIYKKESILFIEKFNLLFGTKYQLTKGREEKLKLRLKSFMLDDILLAVENLSKSKFHTGDNDRGWRADPDFLLRNDEQIDKWINKKSESVFNQYVKPISDEMKKIYNL